MERPGVSTYVYGNAEIVVHRPNLDDKERRKREDNVKRALAIFGRAMANTEKEMTT